jgi:NADPH-dependent 2,4-dienoyl-CoA reductase/sulfur reductase-like enzyme
VAGHVRALAVLGPSDHVVVVGAGLAGWRTCEALRREGFEGAITLVGDEPYAPYDRPPLSKQVLSGKWSPDHTTLATEELVAKNDVTLRLGAGALRLDVATTTVHLSDDTSLAGTHVVIATGSRARRLAYTADRFIHSVRSRHDLTRLVDEVSALAEGDPVAIIGGGFIGAEVATSLHSRGFTPTVFEASSRPLVHVLGPDVSQWLVTLPERAGIELRNDQHIRDVVQSAGAEGLTVEFEDGSAREARIVIVGAGAVPNVEWLSTSGLTIDNGVVVDEHLLATDRVAAVGDVARFEWKSVTGTELVRIEHWQIANDHASSLARFWATGEVAPSLLVPYFWSDQYGKKIQMLGHPRPDDQVTRVSGDPNDAKWLALYSRDGVVTGVVALSHPRALMLSKELLERSTALDEAMRRAPWSR